ncbi:MAG: NAD(P)H-dependent oxidoreductase [Cyanobacteria bacterium P01_G01_bin.49]
MCMKILALGASTSSTSINRQFANFAANQIPNAEVTDLDLREINVPIYSSDEENTNGIPVDTYRFLDLIQSHDALVISLAEHNGSYSAAFKNIYDWASRVEKRVWSGKPMLLLSTSPGTRGGTTVMEAAKATFPRMGADLKASFSLPSFNETFSKDGGIKDGGLRSEFDAAMTAFTA